MHTSNKGFSYLRFFLSY